jgi:DNA helicase HerA-like ATPase
MASLRSRLKRISELPFIVREAEESAIDHMIEVIGKGRHVVLQFGRYGRLLEYILVTNVLTRRIHDHYQEQTDNYRQTKKREDRPRQLMITIEEAHKFLNPQAANQTIFGTIAREMRKYHVTLLIVDQRPSGIDSEVLSQIGTRITAALNDEKDIDAVFTGVSGSAHLRSMLATLDPKQQALVMGYAPPMPVVVRTRVYDEQFYKEIGADAALTKEELAQKASQDIKDMFA